VAVNLEQYDAVPPGLWDTYLAHLKHYIRGWGEGRATDEWLAMIPVGAAPSEVVDHLTDKIIEVEPWYERYPADAWMEAGISELEAQLATVLSSHGQEEVRWAVRHVMWGARKRRPSRSPDDVVRDLMRRGVSSQAAYETVLKHCQWDNWNASNSPRAAEIKRQTLSPLSEIEADPSNGWFARLRRGL
jgi:hypothetical protein